MSVIVGVVEINRLFEIFPISHNKIGILEEQSLDSLDKFINRPRLILPCSDNAFESFKFNK
jgi:hypothetical protein